MFSRILSGSRWTVCRNSAKYSDQKSSDRIKKSERIASSRACCTVCSDNAAAHVVGGRR